MSRRRAYSPPPPPFVIEYSLNRMERAVIYRTVDRDLFTADDILEWLVPAENLRHLRAAFPHAQNATHGSFDAHLRLHDKIVHVNIDTPTMGCLTPHDVIKSTTELQSTIKAPAIWMALGEIVAIINEHDVVRRVIKWFNEERVTPGFARHYFPALGALLPTDHAFFSVDGQRFADKVMPHEIATDLRHAPEVIAKGLFCNPDNHGTLEGRVYCSIAVSADNLDSSILDYGQKIPLFAKSA